MSNERVLPRSGSYAIEFEYEASWADSYWSYKVYRWDDLQTPVYQGSAQTRRGAERAGRRVVRKFKKGKLPKIEPPRVVWVL